MKVIELSRKHVFPMWARMERPNVGPQKGTREFLDMVMSLGPKEFIAIRGGSNRVNRIKTIIRKNIPEVKVNTFTTLKHQEPITLLWIEKA